MLKYEKKEIEMEVSLRKKIEFVCNFNKVKPLFINGNVYLLLKQILDILNHIE